MNSIGWHINCLDGTFKSGLWFFFRLVALITTRCPLTRLGFVGKFIDQVIFIASHSARNKSLCFLNILFCHFFNRSRQAIVIDFLLLWLWLHYYCYYYYYFVFPYVCKYVTPSYIPALAIMKCWAIVACKIFQRIHTTWHRTHRRRETHKFHLISQWDALSWISFAYGASILIREWDFLSCTQK